MYVHRLLIRVHEGKDCLFRIAIMLVGGQSTEHRSIMDGDFVGRINATRARDIRIDSGLFECVYDVI